MQKTPVDITKGSIVHWSQINGIVCYGIVEAVGDTHATIHYLYDPDGDPPRRDRTTVEVERLKEGLPEWIRIEKLVEA